MSEDLNNLFAEDAADHTPAAESSLERVTAMANLLMQAAEKVTLLEAGLTAAKAVYLRMEREELPDLMRELTLTSIKLQDGTSVEVKDDLSCSITEFNKPAAHEWLKTHNFGGIIKTNVELSFGSDETELATEIAGKIEEEFHRTPELSEGVHASTLKSFIKEQKESRASNPEDFEGDPFPDQLFGVFEYRKAKVVVPKKKK